MFTVYEAVSCTRGEFGGTVEGHWLEQNNMLGLLRFDPEKKDLGISLYDLAKSCPYNYMLFKSTHSNEIAGLKEGNVLFNDALNTF